MKTMKYMTLILVASMIMISMHVNAAYNSLPMQSTSAMQEVSSRHIAQAQEACAPTVTYHHIPMQSTSTMIETGYFPTPGSDDNDASGIRRARKSFDTGADAEQSNEYPVGEPWILLLFAAATAATVAIRRRARVRQIVLTDAALRH